MADKNGLLTGIEVLPEQLRGPDGPEIIRASPKLQKIIAKAHATLEGNVRLFLEKHCGVIGAHDLETPMEDIHFRMKMLGIQVRHVNVAKRPWLSGTWILKMAQNTNPRVAPDVQPLVCFPVPKMKNGKLMPQMMVKLKTSAIQVVTGLKGNA